MSELIKREDALEAIKTAELWQEYDEVEKVPPVDAVPVVHGRWIDESLGHNWYGKCSACGEAYNVDSWYGSFNYCPNCGARMDGKEQS